MGSNPSRCANFSRKNNGLQRKFRNCEIGSLSQLAHSYLRACDQMGRFETETLTVGFLRFLLARLSAHGSRSYSFTAAITSHAFVRACSREIIGYIPIVKRRVVPCALRYITTNCFLPLAERRIPKLGMSPSLSPVSAYGTDLRLCIKEDLGFVVVTKERK